MNIRKTILALASITLLAGCSTNTDNARREHMLTTWKFSYSEDIDDEKFKNVESVRYNDNNWQTVSVPHDWAINGPFDREIDKQVVAIEQNGEKEATEHTGRTGALPYIGTGWYRTHFKTTKGFERTLIEFQGVMSEPDIYVNGEKAGEWKNGYTPFILDITKLVKGNGQDNIIAVRATNMSESSRWYPGAGIYRPVKIIETHNTAFKEWGISVSEAKLLLDDTEAQFTVNAEIEGDTTGVEIAYEIKHAETGVWKDVEYIIKKLSFNEVQITLREPNLWTPETPSLYDLKTMLYKNGEIVDCKNTRIGIRNVSYTAEKGFQLNGHSRKIKGVCLHHDLGPIGTALNKSALVRQIKLLKGMGCDAIRTSHNIPSSWQMEVCDSMGMMVMAESFDEWIYPKCPNGYHRFFNEKSDNGQTWAERDITALVECHKNHPSIIMWSIGNEIPEQQDPENGVKNLVKLKKLIHSLDPDEGRIVTSGCDRIDDAIKSGFADSLDIVGMNYRTNKYQMAYDNTRQKMILGSETASTVSSRGVYKIPVKRADNQMYVDGQCSSYDQEACWWSNIPESDFELQDDKHWVIGEFVWTGFDYLGEPTPYDAYWPSRSSYFGIFDLAGLPKDRYYLYRSRWNIDDETLHILPHWTWPGHEGDTIPVYCYTSYDEAELFVNGKSQGRIKKDQSKLENRYRLKWENVIYEPGELKVIAYDYDNNEQEKIVYTAGEENHLALTADRTTIDADGNDLAFITVTMLDKDGTMCPTANDELTFEVEGQGQFRAVCNGDPTSLESFTTPKMKLFNGQLVVVVQSSKESGRITLKAHCPALNDAEITIKTE